MVQTTNHNYLGMKCQKRVFKQERNATTPRFGGSIRTFLRSNELHTAHVRRADESAQFSVTQAQLSEFRVVILQPRGSLCRANLGSAH